MYFRSGWEYLYATYLEFLKMQGKIKDWKYEVKFFEFPVKHGTTRYLPDFQIAENSGEIWYAEVKGHLTSKAKTQLKRMAQYFPEVRLEVIDEPQIKELKKFEKLFLTKKRK